MPQRNDKDKEEDKDSRGAVLRSKAVEQGILADSQPVPPDTQLPLSKALVKSNGQDIIKKGTTRKNRYLLVLNCLLAPATSGKLGSLANLDSQEPCMYIDFPNGRLKLFGTLVFPRNKYLLLRTGAAAGVTCEDVFENMIVFSESWWVGTAEENPQEERLPMPSELSTQTIHKDYDFSYGASYQGTRASKQGAPSSLQEPASQSQQDPASQQKPQGPSQEPPLSASRPTRRAAAQKSYRGLDSDNDDDDDGTEAMDMEDAGDEDRQHLSAGAAQGLSGAARAVRPAQHTAIEILDSEDHDAQPKGGRASLEEGPDTKEGQATQGRRRAAAPKRKLKDVSSDAEEDEDTSEEGSSGGEGEESGSMFEEGSEEEKPKRAKPAAKRAPSSVPPSMAKGRKQQGRKSREGTQSPAKKPRGGGSGAQRKPRQPQQRKRKAAVSEDDEDEDEQDNSEGSNDSGAGGASSEGGESEQDDGGSGSGEEEKSGAKGRAGSARRPRPARQSTAKRITYAESDGEDEEEEEESEEEGDDSGDENFDGGSSRRGAARKQPAAPRGRGRGGAAAAKRPAGGAARGGKAGTKSQSPDVFEISSDDD